MVEHELIKVLVKSKVFPKIVEVRQLEMDKDGTAYGILAMRFEGEASFCGLGCVGRETYGDTMSKGGWLVIEGLHRKAYFFSKKGFLDTGYVFDKLCRAGFDLSGRDAQNITALLSVAIDRPADPFPDK